MTKESITDCKTLRHNILLVSWLEIKPQEDRNSLVGLDGDIILMLL